MSHFTVLVRLEHPLNPLRNLTELVDEELAPFIEQVEQGSPYAVFHDHTKERREEFETEKLKAVRFIEDDQEKLLHRYERRFRVRSGGLFEPDTWKYPEGSEQVEVSAAELYGDFEGFMTQHHGEEPDEQGRYGYWDNPNAKWDWWVVGGRWSNMLRHKNGEMVDWCQVKDLDLAWGDKQAEEKAREFHAAYQRMLDGHRSNHPFCPTRTTALNLGLMECMEVDKLTGDEFKVNRWPDKDMCDVLKPIELDDLLVQHTAHFWPFGTFARLFKGNWEEKGDMGWWGMSSATPETRKANEETQKKWILSGDNRDVLVVVDCHI